MIQTSTIWFVLSLKTHDGTTAVIHFHAAISLLNLEEEGKKL